MKMRKQLTRLLLGALCALLVPPLFATAAELEFTSDTLVRGFERDTVSEEDALVLPAYEYLRVNAGESGEPGLSFHLYGWGRWDAADNDYFDDQTAGEILYGYLDYRGEEANFMARFGRQYVFEGVANEAIDGLRLSSDLGKYFQVSAYAGQPVSLDSTDGRDGDIIYGGRLGHRMPALYDVGVSYKLIENDDDTAEEFVGVDLGLYLPGNAVLSGSSSYNLETEGWGEHSYSLRFNLAGLNIRPYYEMFEYEDYFGTGANSANPFRFLAGTDEELTIVGADATWAPLASWDFAAKVKNYDYDVRDDSSQYYALLASWHGEDLPEIGGEAGLMDGDSDENKYYLLRAYTYWDSLPEALPLAFISGDVVWVKYDREIFNEDNSLFVSLGIGQRFLDDSLALKLSGDYSSDPYFDNDLRGLLTLSYHYGRTL